MGPREGLCLLLTEYYAGPRGSLIRLPALPWMGRRELTVKMLPTCNGPTRYSCEVAHHVPDGPMRATCTNVTRMQRAHARDCASLPLTEYYAGPRDSVVRQYPTSLIGPYKPIVQMFLRPAEYYFGPRDCLVWLSPTPLIGPYKQIVQMFLRPAEYYFGPRDSLVQQPAMSLIGQCELIV